MSSKERLKISTQTFEALKDLSGELHLAIGIFDGVHLGHKAVIESAVFSACRSGGVSGVLTFDPHPSCLFRPDEPTQLIMNIEDKATLLHAMGIDIVVRKHFDYEFSAIPADGFLAHLKKALPTLTALYVGENFRFGKGRIGDVGTLLESAQVLGLSVFSLDRIKCNGEPISSTRIREALRSGFIEEVNDLLGFNYFSKSTVVGGKKLGRKLGFPTLNLLWEPECCPCYGVYAVRFREVGKASWALGVANYGLRPTLSLAEAHPVLEVHALDGTLLDVGAKVEVEWFYFIRVEQKFDGVEALKAQIEKDCEQARRLLRRKERTP